MGAASGVGYARRASSSVPGLPPISMPSLSRSPMRMRRGMCSRSSHARLEFTVFWVTAQTRSKPVRLAYGMSPPPRWRAALAARCTTRMQGVPTRLPRGRPARRAGGEPAGRSGRCRRILLLLARTGLSNLPGVARRRAGPSMAGGRACPMRVESAKPELPARGLTNRRSEARPAPAPPASFGLVLGMLRRRWRRRDWAGMRRRVPIGKRVAMLRRSTPSAKARMPCSWLALAST